MSPARPLRIAQRHAERIRTVDLDDRAGEAAADVSAVEEEVHERDHVWASVAAPVSPPTGGEESSTLNRAETTYA